MSVWTYITIGLVYVCMYREYTHIKLAAFLLFREGIGKGKRKKDFFFFLMVQNGMKLCGSGTLVVS